MVDIVATPEWKSVRILERDEVALGGYGGNMNEQATALVARTELLMQEKADTSDIIQGQYSFPTLAEFDSKKETIPANSVVIIDEVGDNQGTNTWNGTTLTKSAYDPLNQAKLYTNAKSEIIESRIPYKNLFDERKIRLNFYLNSANGAISSSANSVGWGISDFMTVVGGEYYTLSGKSSGRISFFTAADDSLIPVLTVTGANPKTIQAPIEAKYAVINVHSSTDPVYTNVQFEKGQVATTYADSSGLNVTSLDSVELVEQLDSESLKEKVGTFELTKEVNRSILDIGLKLPYKNLFDDAIVRDGFYMDTSGVIRPLADWGISSFIPIEEGEYYTFSGTALSRISFFADADDSLTPLSTITGDKPLTAQAPVGAKYAVLALYSPQVPTISNVQLEKGQVATAYSPYLEVDSKRLNPVELVQRLDDDALANKISEIIPVKPYEIVTASPNLLDESKNSLGKYLANTTGEIVTNPDTSWVISGFIPLEGGETYTISGTRYSLRYTLFSGTAGTAAQALQTVVPSTNTHTFVAPQNCYLVLALDHPVQGIHSGVQVERGAAATDYMPYGIQYEINPDYIAGSGGGSGASSMQISGANLIIRGKDHTGASVEVTSRLTQPTSFDSRSVFNFTSCIINGSVLVTMGDDVAPYYVNNTVIGANHGYDKIEVTSTDHGKTTADCGSIWSADGRQWVLFAIVDTNNLLFMCTTEARSSIAASQMIHVSDAVHDSVINISSFSWSQLYPVFKNRQLSIFADGDEIEIADSTRNYSKSVIVKESYEVMLRADIVANIIANKGVQLAEFNAPAAFRVNISYVFDHEAGCTLEQDFLILKQTTLESLTMMQSILVPATNGAVYYYVPKSLPVLVDEVARDFRQPIDIRSLNIAQLQTFFTASELEDPNNPIDRAYQINNLGVFATGFLPVADATPERRLSLVENQFWGIRNTLKTYPKLAIFNESKDVDIGEYYSCISYKKWFSKQTEQTACFPVRSSAGDFLYLDWHSTGLKNVKIPKDFKYRPFSVVEKSENINLLSTDFVQDELLVNIQGGDYGYLVLKFK